MLQKQINPVSTHAHLTILKLLNNIGSSTLVPLNVEIIFSKIFLSSFLQFAYFE